MNPLSHFHEGDKARVTRIEALLTSHNERLSQCRWWQFRRRLQLRRNIQDTQELLEAAHQCVETSRP